MKYVIETERLGLREFALEDDGGMFEMNADPLIKRFTADDPYESVEAARKFLNDYSHYDENGYGRWSVILKETDEFLGWCGLKNNIAYIDLGFRLIKRHRGKGYATEAALACLDYGFNSLGMEEIVGRAVKDNIDSINVIKKIGMRFWKEDECNGIYDSVYYRINKNQYVLSKQIQKQP